MSYLEKITDDIINQYHLIYKQKSENRTTFTIKIVPETYLTYTERLDVLELLKQKIDLTYIEKIEFSTTFNIFYFYIKILS